MNSARHTDPEPGIYRQSQRVNSIPIAGMHQRTIGRSGDINEISSKWAELQKESGFGKVFQDKAKILHNDLISAIQNAGDQNKVEKEISYFLHGNDERNAVDDCVRWVILSIAVGETEDASSDQESIIMQVILRDNASLAFLNINQGSIKNICKASTKHFNCTGLKNTKTTPYHKAATLGNAKAIDIILSRGKTFYQGRPDALFSHNKTIPRNHDRLLDVARQTDSGSERTALELAVFNGREEAVGMLLEAVPGLVMGRENTFMKIINEGRLGMVEKFLSVDLGKKLFATSKYIVQAVNNEEKGEASDSETSGKIINLLITLSNPNEKYKLDVLGALMRLGLMDTFNHILPEMPDDIRSSLLHLAVRYQSVKFVEEILDKYPAQVAAKVTLSEGGGPNYPLWYNNWRWEQTSWVRYSGDIKIRSMIIHHTMRLVKKMKDLSEIFHQSGEPARELCFDLSRLDSRSHPVSELFKSLTYYQKSVRKLEYEETIRYAEFPALDLNVNHRETIQDYEYLPDEHTEVFKILDWLQEKKVQSIISLKVLDRMVNPHNESEIANYVKKFKVEILDWRFLDMSIDVFDTEVRDRITELHLYASGKRAPISHWKSSVGVSSLPKLERLYIHVIKETITEESCARTVAKIRTDFSTLLEKKARVSVDPEYWNPRKKMPSLNEIARRVAPKLSIFIESYRNLRLRHDLKDVEAIKVAIIDNGILSFAPRPEDSLHPAKSHANGSLLSRIMTGRSFVDENYKQSPWYLASDPHGTQMANLICAMDPFCELYVAKVADLRHGMTPTRVARAIHWARSHKVNVISMSFTMLDKNKDLEDAMLAASSDRIVMLCSSHDEGLKLDSVWPANHTVGSKLVIAACNEFGQLIQELKEEKYDLRVAGVKVPVGVIPFLDSSEECISGSSVATSLIAGVSSLILSCYRLAAHLKNKANKTNEASKALDAPFEFIKKQLEIMMPDIKNKFILLERFARIDQKIRKGEDVDAETIILENFGD